MLLPPIPSRCRIFCDYMDGTIECAFGGIRVMRGQEKMPAGATSSLWGRELGAVTVDVEHHIDFVVENGCVGMCVGVIE